MVTASPARVILVTMAHPDDESFGVGGTLALYASQGVQVHLVCLTGGEVGTVDPVFMQNFSTIAELRANELRCASQILGLASVEVGWYRDSGMPGTPDNHHPEALINQPVEEVARRLAAHIRKVRPQVILTHDPIGGYKHPDHIAVQKATWLAFQLAADPGVELSGALPPHQVNKLYYHTFPKGMLRFFVGMLRVLGQDPRRFGRNKDIDLAALVEEGNFPIHLRINTRKVVQAVEAASACHASQLGGGPPQVGVFRALFRWFTAFDTFTRAFPETPAHFRERDLFDGIELVQSSSQ